MIKRCFMRSTHAAKGPARRLDAVQPFVTCLALTLKGMHMIKITVLYGQPAQPDVFEKYYAQTHLPLVAEVQGIQRTELTLFAAAADGSLPEYYRMAELYFDSKEQMDSAMSSTVAQIAVADIANFASGGATVLVGQVHA